MRSRTPRLTAALAAVLLGCLTALGCADRDPPAGVVATVDDRQITRGLVERWGDFDVSIREELGLSQRPRKNAEAVAVRSLIHAEWVRREADRRKTTLEPRERRAALTRFASDLGLSRQHLERHRRAAGLRTAELEMLAEARVLTDELAARDPRRPSPVELLRYYRRHAADLGRPERRSFEFLVTVSEGGAERARTALEQGEGWQAVAEDHGHPDALREYGWRMSDLTQSEVGDILDARTADRAFSVSPHELVGPVALERGWGLFEVVDERPGFRPPFAVVREAVRNRLIEQRRDSSRERLALTLRARYAKRTRCAQGLGPTWCRPLPATRRG